ncbi:sigma-54 interaction domain-containing protein [Piscinibacter sakaiensis]|uniref:sigma-54 interaction domain-containing protein n=1 Tax=Piscinibacter sakaiensis TaxID=1547922 RepID=UPI003AACBC6C
MPRPLPSSGSIEAALSAIVGVSESICALRRLLPRLAAADCSVLITGETGTGKECVAQALHQVGPRHHAPLVSINCAALPESLLDSELFGYERGAFTGANSAYPGKITLAEGGTLFLDEIGDMPLPAQAKLLRVLETHEVFPIGARRSRRVDFRVVAATHGALEQLVRNGRFRADLFYRLNVARVELAPLRERREDVAVLFEHFARQLAARSRFGRLRLQPAALARLCQHEWPGNARELRNLVEAACIVFEGEALHADELPLPAPSGDADESTRIVEALERCEWNRSKAAALLHWSRMTLYRKMKHLHIGH